MQYGACKRGITDSCRSEVAGNTRQGADGALMTSNDPHYVAECGSAARVEGYSPQDPDNRLPSERGNRV